MVVKESDNTLEELKELILRLEHLEKEAITYLHRYIREFGELIEESFVLKIESIKLKKSIAFCQARKNRGQPIEQSELDEYIEEGMDKYYQELEVLVSIRDEELNGITTIDYARIKKLYYKIVNQIHPDLYPERFQEGRIQELWERAKDAYQRNDYDVLCNVEILVATILEELGVESEIEVDNLLAKIAKVRQDIAVVMQNEPYMHKYLLEDDAAIARKRQEFAEEIEEYTEYIENLKEELASFTIEKGRMS